MRGIIRVIVKLLLWAIAGLAGLIVLGSLIAALVYSPEYVRRLLLWRESTVDVYRNGFPQRRLTASPEPFTFKEAPAEARVEGIFEQIFDTGDFKAFLEETESEAFIVIQDDAILYEGYFNGAERETMMTSYSMAKSFDTALVGIAIEEGYIESVDDPITRYLPELADRDPRFGEVTIRHLMLMASGFDYQEMRPLLFNSDDTLSSYHPDQRHAALTYVDIVDRPGDYFRYNKYHPQLLGLILERTTGMSVTEYTQEKLWDPIGMEFDGAWSLDSETSGFEKMETGVNARAIDFAKFGRLYLENGDWDGVQVVPAEWVADSTRPDSTRRQADYYPDGFGQAIYDDLNGYYKYMWYGYLRDGAEPDFAAEGDRGQFIYVSPHKKLIIVRTGLNYGRPWWEWVAAFYEFAGEL